MAGEAYLQCVTITSLPREIIQQILEDRNLKIRDILSVAQTCKQLYMTVSTMNQLWKTKFFQRWPSSREDYEEERACGGLQWPNWRKETMQRIVNRTSLLEKLSVMAATHGITPELPPSVMKDYDQFFLPQHGASPMNYYYLTDMLTFLGRSPSSFPLIEGEQNFKAVISDVIQKHYAHRVNKYIKSTYFAMKRRKFLALPIEQQTMEQGAIFVTKWCQRSKRISGRKISQMLDDIAQQTRTLVTERHPFVWMHSVKPAEVAQWKKTNLYHNKCNSKDARLIFETLCEVMYDCLGFYATNPEDSTIHSMLIDYALKHKSGSRLVIAVIFESVARRLGLHCEIICFSGRHLIRWAEEYRGNDNGGVTRHYIDVFTADPLDETNQLLVNNRIDESTIQHESNVSKVMQQMFAYIKVTAEQTDAHNQRSAQPPEADRKMLELAVQLMIQMKPQGASAIDHLANFYVGHKMDATELVKTLGVVMNMQNGIQVDEEFATSQSLKILCHITEDLKSDRIARRQRWKRMRIRSSAPCRCCKCLRDFAKGLKRRRVLKAKKQCVHTRRR